ncbi:AbrB/MazE/SpoVT family DNA-binding domain-containing protein [Methylobacterium persicinum]|uniref:Bifunctional DNA-binding transcriptional regulator/antitoxin component of YhaV-PrlF toxin-antitoxin module n=1 Tax=Methylobacterium persicinum TaxID=374426 RepID=A0ABU0HME7_9HYPH|nr:AbrB/MazE/SpoVT family DNA-binding domain-containing protein [Methylobacterium persicinum]MDQ0442855.1 bifunctional DNA-binding transcriptional regulator/antitoxin component of YhaV-PrlF toxin-antitoxin module [Methylobacterium persicinum]GJE36901.1 hypothetical protein KHHGKMAE_0956 [Methylobacterium persicinum]
MSPRAIKITDGGELAIPASFRQELGVEVGDTVLVEVANGELRVRSRSSAVANAQRLMRQLVSDDISLVNELIADRRVDAGRD